MKKIVISLLMVMSATILLAQTDKELPPATERAQQQTEYMKEKLDLTSEQEPKVYDANLAMAIEIDRIIKLTDKRAKFNGFRQAQLKKDESLKKVLTKDQYKTYKAMKKDMQKKFKEYRKDS